MKGSLVRVGALAAIAGGLLRAAASFAPALISSDLERQSLYVVVDVCLSAGLLAFWALRSEDLRKRGAAGVVIALTGIVTIRANRLMTAVDLYPAGALAIAFGMIVVSVSAWVVNKISVWVPLMFLLSTLVGVLGSVVRDASVLFVWSGVMFGVAFAGLGVEAWTASNA
jgi:hypothetical protein